MSVAEYRKKPVVISAMLWEGNQKEAFAFMPGPMYLTEFDPDVPIPGLIIKTLEGEMTANAGDYIIKGVAGEFYPCKPDIFAATYEKVNV